MPVREYLASLPPDQAAALLDRWEREKVHETMASEAPVKNALQDVASGLGTGLGNALWGLGTLPLAMIVVAHERNFLRRTTSRALRLHGGRVEACEL